VRQKKNFSTDQPLPHETQTGAELCDNQPSLGGFVSMMVREKDREYALYANSKGSSNS
jgi:hypothetical protein